MDLVSFLPVAEQDVPEEYIKTLRDRYEEALSSLINKKTPKEAIYSRKARGGSMVSYVTGWWIVDQLNALFGYNWDFEIVQMEIIWKINQLWVWGKLTVKGADGSKIVKSSFGSGEIKIKKGTSDPVDVGDDLKAAQTDSLKKCASMLGIAADVYKGSGERQTQKGVSQGQLDTLNKVAKDKGLTEDKLEEISKDTFGKSLDDLEASDILILIGKVRDS